MGPSDSRALVLVTVCPISMRTCGYSALVSSTMTVCLGFRAFEAKKNMDSHGVVGCKALSLVRDIGSFQNSGRLWICSLPLLFTSLLPSHTCFSRVLWCISNPGCLPPSVYFLSSVPVLAQTWGLWGASLASLAPVTPASLLLQMTWSNHLKSLLPFSPQGRSQV